MVVVSCERKADAFCFQVANELLDVADPEWVDAGERPVAL